MVNVGKRKKKQPHGMVWGGIVSFHIMISKHHPRTGRFWVFFGSIKATVES